jgi:hypothetical protein
VRRHVLALAAIVLAGTIAYGALGTLLRGPSVFADELIYMDATRSVSEGHRPVERDRPYGRGLLYPVLGAPVVALAPNQLAAYRALRVFNAFLFALTAIPAYLLARRFVGRWWSVLVALLSVAVPSAVYTGMVLTESAAYLTGTLALLALVAAVERPTGRRQLLALGAVALAALARPQLVALVVALPVGFVARWGRGALRQLWPTAAAAGAVVVLGALAFATGRASLRDYRDVFTSYDVVDVARWSWYTLGDLALYLALVPLIAAPAAISLLWRRGSPADRAFVALFAAVNVVTIVLVAAFSSASFGGDRLHDRYLFYVVPLWLVLFAAWLERGAPASWRALALGTAFTAALVATIPQRLLLRDTNLQFDAVASALWARVRAVDPGRPGLLSALLVLTVLLALVAIVLARRHAVLLLLPLAVVFVLNAVFVWESRRRDADLRVFANNRPSTWSWVDRAVPDGARVTNVFVDSGRCEPVNHGAFRWTEFFNGSIAPVIRLGVPAGITTDGRSARITTGRVIRTLDGEPVRAQYVVAPPGLSLRGRVIARGTLSNLALWHVGGIVRTRNAHSNAQAVVIACA